MSRASLNLARNIGRASAVGRGPSFPTRSAPARSVCCAAGVSKCSAAACTVTGRLDPQDKSSSAPPAAIPSRQPVFQPSRSQRVSGLHTTTTANATHTAAMPSAIPQFPDGLLETDLYSLPLSGIIGRDPETERKLWDICQSHGFFYLNLAETPRGQVLLDAASRLEGVASDAFHSVPMDVRESIGLEKTKSLFGWKASGAVNYRDPHQRKDVGQFFNVSKDDVLQHPNRVGVDYPSPIKEEMNTTFKTFVTEAHSTGLLVMEALARQLGLSPHELTHRHKITEKSGDHVRLTWGPGDEAATDALPKDEASTRITTYGHTDFGSVTLLFNWLGGLQIENAATGSWEWVRPMPGHAICNLGDAMVEFSGGRLRSGKHRVVAAPGLQARLERYSVVYFVRPEDEVEMQNLTASKVKEHAQESPNAQLYEKKWKAGDWINHRAAQMGTRVPDPK